MAAQQLSKASLAELLKRCPKNQMKQFNNFRDKTMEYQARVAKFPGTLPKVDWEYYRKNVRNSHVQMVEDFEKRYEELNKLFECRDQQDTAKYYTEIEQQHAEVQEDIKKYIAESNKRIKAFEKEIARLRALIPPEQMTMEDFLEGYPHCPFFTTPDGKPSFWPHLPEEQKPGPSGPTPEEAEREANAKDKAKRAEATAAAEAESSSKTKKPSGKEEKKPDDKKSLDTDSKSEKDGKEKSDKDN